MKDAEPLLIPNIGAEEGGDWRLLQRHSAVRTLAALWRGLLDARGGAGPVFDGIGGPGCAIAWLNTRDAAHEAAAAGRRLAGSDPDVVMRVHDKAFAHAAARSEGQLPACLADCTEVFEPEILREPDRAIERLARSLGGWPAWTGGRFTLKPRFGGSGRGRVGGVWEPERAALPGGISGPERAALRAGLRRLADRGGAVLEPWLERDGDYSTQLLVGEDARLVVLGTLVQLVSSSGQPLGCRGDVDRRGRVSCAERCDDALREAAAAVALRAAAQGFHGPCGVDAFRFRGPQGPVLRPLVELNARFTAGTVALGLVRRALPELPRRLGLTPDRPVAFLFRLDAPAAGWPEEASGGDRWLVPLHDADAGPRPALLFARRREDLDAFAH